jgi:GT2 family glycosyltransferase
VLATRFVLFNQAVAIRKEALNESGGFNEGLWVMEDYDLALRLALMGPWAYINEPLVIWHRDSNKSLHAQAQNDQIRLHENIKKIYVTILRKNSIECSVVRKYLQRNLGISRYELLAAKMFEKGLGRAIGIGGPLKYFNRFRNALFRRSPWYPRMEVVPIEQYS